MAIEVTWFEPLISVNTLTNVHCAGEVGFFFPQTMADLKAIPASLCNKAAFLAGYVTAGDGLGGVFTWSRADTTLGDDVTVINPTGNTAAGRWRKFI